MVISQETRSSVAAIAEPQQPKSSDLHAQALKRDCRVHENIDLAGRDCWRRTKDS